MDRKILSTGRRTQRLFRKLEKIVGRISSRAAPEAVHQLRTTVRRVETLITAHSLTEQRSIAKLAKQLAILRRRGGKVRDLDVQVAALRSVHPEAGDHDKAVLARHLLMVRRKRERKLLGTLQREIDSGLRKRMQRGAKLLAKKSQAAPSKDFSAEALRKFRILVEGYPPLSEENLHQFRMECKRIRYLAEMSGETKEAARVVAPLKHVQDAIGEWHDWLTLTETAEEVITHPASPLLAALRTNKLCKFNEALGAVTNVEQQLLSKPAVMEGQGPGRIQPHRTGDATLPVSQPPRKQAQSAVEPGAKDICTAAG